MDKTYVSILVPIYGVEKYIERCAVSLFEQSYSNIEFIFVDDCTNDNSIQILQSVIDRYPERKGQIHIIRHEFNKGLAGARITALSCATSEYILHVDSDDYIAIDAVQKLVDKAIETGADIVDAAYQKIVLGNVGDTTYPFRGNDVDYLHLILSKTGLINHQIWGKLIKTSLYKENYINAIEGVNHAEDYSVFPKLLLKCKKRVSINEVLFYYNYDNENSLMHKLSEKSFVSSFKAAQSVYTYFKGNVHDSKYDFSLDFGMANLYLVLYKNNIPVSLLDDQRNYVSNFFILRIYVFFLHYKRLQFLGHLIFKLIKNVVYYPKFKSQMT